MQAIIPENITTDTISLPELAAKDVQIDILRLDKIHPVISGNKWFKLRYYLEDAIKLGKKHILTFGGAWSNHIVATAAACKYHRLNCTGIIRGEEPARYSATLREAVSYGMQFHFSSRPDYADKKIPDALNAADTYIIPEGGYGTLGAQGASAILQYCEQSSYTHICCAVGTGTMAAGLIRAANAGQRVIAFSVLKNNYQLTDAIHSLINVEKEFTLIHDYHFGGYAKYTPALISFINQFYRQTTIPLDFVYTGKLLYGIISCVKNEVLPPGARILAIHSGGLQGNTSMPKGTLIF